MFAFITGSGFYDYPGLKRVRVETRFGEATVLSGRAGGRDALVLPRHGDNHERLPHHINHRAHLLALKEAGATAVVSLSVCGLLRGDWPLARPLLADDLYFPENRLPGGEPCTVFDRAGAPDRGHLLASSFFHSGVTERIEALAGELFEDPRRGIYGSVLGPRFNSAAEIRALAHAAGVDFISQTCGPEAVLANELELPYALVGFGVDYANGVGETPTPVETLRKNLGRANAFFTEVIERLVEPDEGFSFENFIYRFES
jgi:5'-methylthioadenosine phosphorylase